MTQEEMLKRARELYECSAISDKLKNELESAFPELKESEDEKIIRTLKEIVNWGCAKNISVENNVKLIDCLTWLEKQKHLYETTKDRFYREGFEEGRLYEKQFEQKHIECIKFTNEFENQVSHLIASVLNGEHEYNEGFVKYASQSLLGFAKKELKTDYWSEAISPSVIINDGGRRNGV